MTIREYIVKMSVTAKSIAVIITAVVTVGGAFAAGDKYVVDEKEMVQSIQQLDQKFSAEIGVVKTQNKMMRYDFKSQRYFEIRRELRLDPADELLIEELKVNNNERATLRKELGL